MRILILYNLAHSVKKGTSDDLTCEKEISIIVPLMVDLLSARGHQVDVLQTEYDLWEQLKMRRGQFNIVLNMAEAFGGTNTHETLVPAILEALDIPFTGASSHNMHLTLDKEKTKLVAKEYGIPVPNYQILRTPTDKLKSELKFPLIAKPVREEASIGIHLDSVVKTQGDLYRKVSSILHAYGQPVIVEEFIEGREISVGVIGNVPNLTVLPPLEFLFSDASSDLEKIRSYEYKWGGRKEEMVRSDLSNDAAAQLAEYTRIAYVVTECRDYARVDYRLDNCGNIFLLEVNYNPGIGPNTHGLNNTLTMMASFTGMTFEDLTERIILIAAERLGIR